MSEKRTMKKLIGCAAALFGVIYLIGTAGCLEAETMSLGAVVIRLAIGCTLVAFGATVSGGLE